MQNQVPATPTVAARVPWNKDRLIGAKPPLRPKHVWTIRTKLQVEHRTRDLAMFNLAIDSKLRGCDDASISTRQYARLVSAWIAKIGLDPKFFGTHSLRRTKATLIYRRTGNLRAVQLLLGHRKIESTARYLGIEVDDALAIAEQVDI
jgi:integrase